MRKFAYWLCFTLIAIPATANLIILALSLIGVVVREPNFLSLFSSFVFLVPPSLPFIPMPVMILLAYVMSFLLLRRTWLTIAKKETVPLSFRGFPMVLGYIGAFSFSFAFVGLLLSIALKAGSGVPTGMLLIPATFCVPWAFFLTEALSFRKAAVNREA